MKPEGFKPGKGSGLSIERFAKVKSATFDKERLLKKQKVQQFKRAKQYRKAKQKLLSEGKLPAPTSRLPVGDTHEHDSDVGTAHKSDPSSPAPVAGTNPQPSAAQLEPRKERRQKKQKRSSLQLLAEQRAKAQEEAQQKKEEAQRAAEARKAQMAAAEKRRKKQTVKLFKKTKKGQPIMKYRVEKMLASLTGP